MPDQVPREGEKHHDDPAPPADDSSAPRARVGCADLPPGLRRERYFERLDYLENEGTRRQLPSSRVLQRWLDEAAGRGSFGLLAPQVITDRPGPKGYPRGDQPSPEERSQAGGFRSTPLIHKAVGTLAAACTTLAAETVIFRSPADFVPSTTNRDTLRRFFGDVAPAEVFGNTTRVWEPQGLWEVETAARLAEELDLVYACDPISNDPLAAGPEVFASLPGDLAYFRITGLGQQARLDEFAIERLLELVDAYQRIWIVFAHIHKYPDAIRCRQLLTAYTAADD